MFDDYNKYNDAFEDEQVDEMELYDMYENEREQEEYYMYMN